MNDARLRVCSVTWRGVLIVKTSKGQRKDAVAGEIGPISYSLLSRKISGEQATAPRYDTNNQMVSQIEGSFLGGET